MANTAENNEVNPAEKDKTKPARRNFFRKGKILLIAIVSVSLILIGLLIGQRFSGIFTDVGTKITGTTIQNSFRDIAELASEQYNFTAVGKFTDGVRR